MKCSLLETHLSGFLAPSLMSADLLPEHPMINCKKKKITFMLIHTSVTFIKNIVRLSSKVYLLYTVIFLMFHQKMFCNDISCSLLKMFHTTIYFHILFLLTWKCFMLIFYWNGHFLWLENLSWQQSITTFHFVWPGNVTCQQFIDTVDFLRPDNVSCKQFNET